jgi:hypothetical protein
VYFSVHQFYAVSSTVTRHSLTPIAPTLPAWWALAVNMEDITKSYVEKPAISLEVHLMAGLEELETVAIVETLSSAQRAEEINADNDRNIDGEYRDHLPLHHPYLMYDFVFFSGMT